MRTKEQFSNSLFRLNSRAATLALLITIGFALTIALPQSAPAQTYKVLYNFTGGSDGAYPAAGLTIDQAGNLYGSTSQKGDPSCSIQWQQVGCGTVFKLFHAGSGWLLSPLHVFHKGDGATPSARPVFGPDGALYGTTTNGGMNEGGVCNPDGCGTVFNLRPPANRCVTALCSWVENVIYDFHGVNYLDGQLPNSEVSFDSAGNLYGTSSGGDGRYCWDKTGCGVVYQLIPQGGGYWTENVIYDFGKSIAGPYPHGGVVSDKAGNLYGVTAGLGYGAVYELTLSGSTWVQTALYSFQNGNDGGGPVGGLIFDPAGNLYGATASGGSGQGGTVFELTPSGGSWTYTLVYSFSAPANGTSPNGNLLMDANGNLYGTAWRGGAYGYGAIFKLTPGSGGWTYTSLHDFTGSNDGGDPYSNVVMDTKGNLYGTAEGGGAYNSGVIWEITP